MSDASSADGRAARVELERAERAQEVAARLARRAVRRRLIVVGALTSLGMVSVGLLGTREMADGLRNLTFAAVVVAMVVALSWTDRIVRVRAAPSRRLVLVTGVVGASIVLGCLVIGRNYAAGYALGAVAALAIWSGAAWWVGR